MGTSAQRAAIKAILQQADPAALVHDYERWTNDVKQFVTLFKPTGDTHLKAWVFAPESEQDLPSTHDSEAHLIVWRLWFLASMVDGEGSEKTALPIVEAAQALIRQNPTLNGSCWSCRPTLGSFAGQRGLVLERWDLQVIGPVLCHVATCRLVTEDYLSS